MKCMKNKISSILVVVAHFLIVSCDPSPENSGDLYSYANFANKTNEPVEFTIVATSKYCTALDLSVAVTLEIDEEKSALIKKEKRVAMYNDKDQMIEVCFKNSDNDKFKFYYDSETSTYNVHLRDVNR